MTLRAALAWPALLVVTVLWSWGAAAQSAPPSVDGSAALRATVGACVEHLDAVPVGLPDLETRCPELPAALQAAGLRPLLIDTAHAVFDRETLRQLPNLIHPAAGPAPTVADLEPILRGLHGKTPAPSRSWLQRIWDWLVERLTPKPQPDGSNPWVNDLLRVLARTQWLWTAILWGTLIALPIAVGYIVVREVRALGGRSIDAPAAAREARGSGPLDSHLALLRQVPPAQRPAQLFALLIARLVAAGRLPPDRSLTHREVARRALLDDAEQRRLIESLARLSERQLYAGVTTGAPGLDELVSRGEDLYTTGWGRPAET